MSEKGAVTIMMVYRMAGRHTSLSQKSWLAEWPFATGQPTPVLLAAFWVCCSEFWHSRRVGVMTGWAKRLELQLVKTCALVNFKSLREGQCLFWERSWEFCLTPRECCLVVPVCTQAPHAFWPGCLPTPTSVPSALAACLVVPHYCAFHFPLV